MYVLIETFLITHDRELLQVEHFHEAFNLFDTDGSGSIDADELGACMRFLGKYYSEDEILVYTPLFCPQSALHFTIPFPEYARTTNSSNCDAAGNDFRLGRD
jgi:hypothetical protein